MPISIEADNLNREYLNKLDNSIKNYLKKNNKQLLSSYGNAI